MRFPLIDVLRAFAALSVVVYHVIAHFNWTEFPISGPLVWFRTGWMGVDLFFVISGFVISLSAFGTLDKTQEKKEFYAHFIRHRAARIIPLHYLTCLIFIIYIQPFMFFDSSAWSQFVTHSLFIYNFFSTHQGGINGVNWSVAVEMQFYLLMMISAAKLRSCKPIEIALAGLAIAWLWRATMFPLTDISGPLGVYPRFLLTTQLPGMLDEFACGILLTRFVRSDMGRHFISKNPYRLWITSFASLVTMTCFLAIYWQNAAFWNSFWMVTFSRTLLGIAWASIILIVCCINYKSIITITKPLQYLGTVSYGIYLWHLSVILSLKTLPWLTASRALPVIIAVTITLSIISWHFFEEPIMLRFSRKLPPTAPNDKVIRQAEDHTIQPA
ncbi:acyltransferase family protein [Beijerinckia indica]|uniref:Acyltransferase 3 n=1 Tax=Beijerinckia indica subsp. indica (strain ATCC 9039 / DSM 1715 / NCIMB 8712) TaxID=395963 RepID=B2IKD8_BEII9|nr:acyltransferase [Beijerinckia indica]ACB96418.1 acyltransferase 3 [Beijerinckia indica subsp. indica ATCC 9039]